MIMINQPLKSIRKFLQWQNKGHQATEHQSRSNAPSNGRHPMVRITSAPVAHFQGIPNGSSDVSMLSSETDATRGAAAEEGVGDAVERIAASQGDPPASETTNTPEEEPADEVSANSEFTTSNYSASNSIASGNMKFVLHASTTRTENYFSDTMSQKCATNIWSTSTNKCTNEFQNGHHYDENNVVAPGCVTTDHDDGANMKRRATTHLESNRVGLPPGSKISVASEELAVAFQNHWNDETKTFENDDMFSDVKMTFIPLSSSIKQFLGLPPTPRPLNVMEWLSDDAPTDIVPHILSFVGSRNLVALSTLNSKWRRIVLGEDTWQTMCENTGKWREGDMPPPSWLELYRNSPCVPLDYNTVESALAAVTSEDGEQHKTVRILLHPAKYILRESLIVRASGSAQVTIESLDISPRVSSHSNIKSFNAASSSSGRCSPETCALSDNQRLSPSQHLTKKIGTMRRSLIRSCLSNSAAFGDGVERAGNQTSLQNGRVPVRTSEDLQSTLDRTRQPEEYHSRRAELVFKTRKQNKPLIHVQKGLLNLKNMDLVHYSVGTDIWSGNTAIQLQPQYGTDGRILPTAHPDIAPTAVLVSIDITSQSGRGIVSIDGGKCVAKKCRVHHCAATGLYVGGPGSEAALEQSDIICNGGGNLLSPRGIARGHSGLYVEQGYARVLDSNVSNNSLTGISAISLDNAVLHIENSDLIGNGTLQLEMPPEGSRSFTKSITRSNVTRARGNPRLRSGLPCEGNSPRPETTLTRNPNQPQSPRNTTGRSMFSSQTLVS